MQLPNFTEFEPFIKLRHQMGAARQGHFELFNPLEHLNGKERSELDQHGRLVNLRNLKRWADLTWGYKNTRLALYLADAPDYHLAQCAITLSWANSDSVWISTRRTGVLPLGAEQNTKRTICSACLQLLGYKGFDLNKNRKIAYSKKLLQEFEREEFFRIYPLYPVIGLAKILE